MRILNAGLSVLVLVFIIFHLDWLVDLFRFVAFVKLPKL